MMQLSSTPMIQIEELSFHYKGQKPLFDHFCWNINKGELWSVLGTSGCGKTTLLYLLAGLLTPDSGRILIDGSLIFRPRPKTGLIIQDFGLLPWETVSGNIALGYRIRKLYGPDGKHSPITDHTEFNPDFWLSKLGISDIKDHYPGQISGGQRQRTAIARTLSLSPDLLLMDEPFASLDAPTRESLQTLILDLQKERNLTILLVTHSIEEAAFIGKHIIVFGNPPHKLPRILHNPSAGQLGFRQTKTFAKLCESLRDILEQPSHED